MKELKPYIVVFKKIEAIKNKIYLFDCAIYNNDYCLIIIISYNKLTISMKNRI